MRFIAPIALTLVVGCSAMGGFMPKTYDDYHNLYNGVVGPAIGYAESLPAEDQARQDIVKIIRRTAPVVKHGSAAVQRTKCADPLPTFTDADRAACAKVGPPTAADQDYRAWATPILKSAIAELTEIQDGR